MYLNSLRTTVTNKKSFKYKSNILPVAILWEKKFHAESANCIQRRLCIATQLGNLNLNLKNERDL
jgi:hypothetical protein